MKIMFLDTETGGLDADKHSLLTIGACIWEDGNIIDEIEIFIKKDNYDFDPISMEINGIDLDFLKLIGVTEEQAIQILEEFSKKHFQNKKVFLGGQNIGFDISFLKKLYSRNNKDFEKKFNHKTIDTVTILYFLYLQGIINENLVSFNEFIKEYNIPVLGKRHSALSDAKTTAYLFNQTLELKRK